MALHGMFPAGKTDTDVAAAFDAAAAAIGLSFESEERSPLTNGVYRNYREPGVEPISFSYTLRPPCQIYLSTGAYPPGMELYAPPRIAEAFTRICVALDADLARSDLGTGSALVQNEEVSGAFGFIDWYQYFGPRLVERIGKERLLTSPAFRTSELERGAVLMMLAPGPWEEGWSRRAVADHLGITMERHWG